MSKHCCERSEDVSLSHPQGHQNDPLDHQNHLRTTRTTSTTPNCWGVVLGVVLVVLGVALVALGVAQRDVFGTFATMLGHRHLK